MENVILSFGFNPNFNSHLYNEAIRYYGKSTKCYQYKPEDYIDYNETWFLVLVKNQVIITKIIEGEHSSSINSLTFKNLNEESLKTILQSLIKF